MTSQAPVIHWFRQDLRLHDHPALSAAAATGQPIIPLYVLEDHAPWGLGGASRWWLHNSLSVLQQSLAECHAQLVLRRGRAVEIIPRLAEEVGASTVFWTRGYAPDSAELEQDLADALRASGVAFRRFGGNLLFEPEDVQTNAGQPFRVFTPFWKACLVRPEPKTPVPTPRVLPRSARLPPSEHLADWKLLPTGPDWAGGLRASWCPGEAGARLRLSTFLDGPMSQYDTLRNRPDLEATSRLSPHLHFGEVSPRQCWHAVTATMHSAGKMSRGAGSFLRQLGWREFCHHLLHHWPDLPDAPFRAEFADFPWRDGEAALAAWQNGQTGYPIVDAGMRELWHTGWMHNRVRMIVASFLVKDLLVPWQRGAGWFWDTLVDADLANNSAGWQWVAGCGADAAPYFRIFNPVLQGRKFDAEGAYVRRWVPELAKLPAEHIHAPWLAPESLLTAADVKLDATYPRPIVDHRQARQAALAAFEQIKRRSG